MDTVTVEEASILLRTEATLTKIPEPGPRLRKRHRKNTKNQLIHAAGTQRLRNSSIGQIIAVSRLSMVPIGTSRFSHATFARIEIGLKAARK